MEYKIVISGGTITLQDIVIRLIKEGWEPIGGAGFNSKTEKYFQTLIKKS